MSAESPKVAILMPAYNAERYVTDAIRSVQNQTMRDWVLHIYDDGSTDGTLAEIRRAAAGDPRITIHTGPNAGIANVMNRGLQAVDCELVACMHADDLMLPNRLERQLAYAAEHADVAVFSSFVEWIDHAGRAVGRSRSDFTTVADVRRKIAAGQVLAFPHPATLFRRSIVLAVGGYRQEFFPAEDTELWNRIAAAGHLVLVQPEVLLRYRVHVSSASTSRAVQMIRKLSWVETCMEARRSKLPEPSWDQFLARRRSMVLLSRLNLHRREWSRIFYQSAIARCAGRQRIRFATALATAAVLDPQLVVFSRIVPRLAQAARRLLGRSGSPIAVHSS